MCGGCFLPSTLHLIAKGTLCWKEKGFIFLQLIADGGMCHMVLSLCSTDMIVTDVLSCWLTYVMYFKLYKQVWFACLGWMGVV